MIMAVSFDCASFAAALNCARKGPASLSVKGNLPGWQEEVARPSLHELLILVKAA